MPINFYKARLKKNSFATTPNMFINVDATIRHFWPVKHDLQTSSRWHHNNAISCRAALMEKPCINFYELVHNDRPEPYYSIDYTEDFETQFCPSQLIEEYNPHSFDTGYGTYPYWDNSLYDRRNLQYRRDNYPPRVDEDNPVIKKNFLTRAFIELWQPNLEPITLEETHGYQMRKNLRKQMASSMKRTSFMT